MTSRNNSRSRSGNPSPVATPDSSRAASPTGKGKTAQTHDDPIPGGSGTNQTPHMPGDPDCACPKCTDTMYENPILQAREKIAMDDLKETPLGKAFVLLADLALAKDRKTNINKPSFQNLVKLIKQDQEQTETIAREALPDADSNLKRMLLSAPKEHIFEVEAPPQFAAQATLTGTNARDRAALLTAHFGRQTSRFSGTKDQSSEIFEILTHMTNAQSQVMLSRTEFQNLLLQRFTGQPWNLLSQWIKDGESMADIYTKCIDRFYKGENPAQAKNKLKDLLKTHTFTSMAEASDEIARLANIASHKLVNGAGRTSYRENLASETFLELVPADVQTILERSISQLKGLDPREPTFAEIISLAYANRASIDEFFIRTSKTSKYSAKTQQITLNEARNRDPSQDLPATRADLLQFMHDTRKDSEPQFMHDTPPRNTRRTNTSNNTGKNNPTNQRGGKRFSADREFTNSKLQQYDDSDYDPPNNQQHDPRPKPNASYNGGYQGSNQNRRGQKTITWDHPARAAYYNKRYEEGEPRNQSYDNDTKRNYGRPATNDIKPTFQPPFRRSGHTRQIVAEDPDMSEREPAIAIIQTNTKEAYLSDSEPEDTCKLCPSSMHTSPNCRIFLPSKRQVSTEVCNNCTWNKYHDADNCFELRPAHTCQIKEN
jgi:hypothetical protein